MVWHSLAPDVSRSVKSNGTILTDNTAYIESTMGNTANDTTNTNAIRDHYWNVSSVFDGRHRFLNMPTFTISGSATDPVIGSGMDGVTYIKKDNVTNRHDLHYRNSSGVKKIISSSAYGYITDITGTPTLTNAFNIASVSLISTGIVGVNFTTNLPDANYIVNVTLGDSAGIGIQIPSASKLNNSFRIHVINNNGVLANPTQIYFMVFC